MSKGETLRPVAVGPVVVLGRCLFSGALDIFFEHVAVFHQLGCGLLDLLKVVISGLVTLLDGHAGVFGGLALTLRSGERQSPARQPACDADNQARVAVIGVSQVPSGVGRQRDGQVRQANAAVWSVEGWAAPVLLLAGLTALVIEAPGNGAAAWSRWPPFGRRWAQGFGPQARQLVQAVLPVAHL